MKTMKADVGLVGLAVMGRNLALNIEEKGFSVAVFNRHPAPTAEFMGGEAAGRRFLPANSLREFVGSLCRPRRIILMIKSGKPVDDILAVILPMLSRGDVVMDGGNSNYHDTERRQKVVIATGISFVGMGVSGGEFGARFGPSIMPGGDREAYLKIRRIIEKAAARTEDGPCCTFVGKSSAGHFTKMVHNGIEYAVMQILAEAWDIMTTGLGMKTAEAREVFGKWNAGPLSSYLVEISEKVLGKIDPITGRPLVELISGIAAQKGTGKWTTEAALDLGVPVPTITAAVDARIISGHRSLREEASRTIGGASVRIKAPRAKVLAELMKAVRGATLLSYAQGLHLLARASKEYGYGIRLSEVCRIWKGGCIIRARELDMLMQVFKTRPVIEHLFQSRRFSSTVRACVPRLRLVVERAVSASLPVPALSSALAYRDSFARVRLPANLTQAQRDYFGAHTFERTDRKGVFHEDWES